MSSDVALPRATDGALPRPVVGPQTIVGPRAVDGSRLGPLAPIPTPPTKKVRALAFRPELEGLRGFAIVLLGRPEPDRASARRFGRRRRLLRAVGFVITSLLLREHRFAGRIGLWAFYRARAQRVLPMALLVLAVTWVAARIQFSGPRTHAVQTDTGWAAGLLANVHFAAVDADPFGRAASASPVLHFWPWPSRSSSTSSPRCW